MFADLVGEAWDTADELLGNGRSMIQMMNDELKELEHSDPDLHSGESRAQSMQQGAHVNKDGDNWESLLEKQQELWLRSRELRNTGKP